MMLPKLIAPFRTPSVLVMMVGVRRLGLCVALVGYGCGAPPVSGGDGDSGDTGVLDGASSGPAATSTGSAAGSTGVGDSTASGDSSDGSGSGTDTGVAETSADESTDGSTETGEFRECEPLACTDWGYQVPNANGRGNAVAVDSAGNVYSAGHQLGNGVAWLFKHTADGALSWVDNYSGPDGNTFAQQWGIAIDSLDHVVVAGTGIDANFIDTPYARKLDGDGNVLWTWEYASAPNSLNSWGPVDVVVDDADGVTIAINKLLQGAPDVWEPTVVHLDSDGVQQWEVAMTWQQPTRIEAMARDGAGNLVFVGTGQDELSPTGAYLAKYDSDGNFTWSQPVYGGTAYGSAVAVDADGTIYFAGESTEALDGPALGGLDVFVTKLDANGAPEWTRGIATEEPEVARALAIDAAGRLWVFGDTGGVLDERGAGPSADLFFAMLDARGNLTWTQQLSSTPNPASEGLEIGADLALDCHGNAHFVGRSSGDLFDGVTVSGSTVVSGRICAPS